MWKWSVFAVDCFLLRRWLKLHIIGSRRSYLQVLSVPIKDLSECQRLIHFHMPHFESPPRFLGTSPWPRRGQTVSPWYTSCLPCVAADWVSTPEPCHLCKTHHSASFRRLTHVHPLSTLKSRYTSKKNPTVEGRNQSRVYFNVI